MHASFRFFELSGCSSMMIVIAGIIIGMLKEGKLIGYGVQSAIGET